MSSRHAYPAFYLFPAFEKLGQETLARQGICILSAKLPRILGQGRTRARGFSICPQRRSNLPRPLPALTSSPRSECPLRKRSKSARPDAKVELELEAMQAASRNQAVRSRRDQAASGLTRTRDRGQKDGQYYAGRFVLTHDKAGANWAWSLNEYYPIISKIPPDPDYVVRAHAEAEGAVQALVLAPETFEQRLTLSHAMARVFSTGEDVLIQDVAQCTRLLGRTKNSGTRLPSAWLKICLMAPSSPT